MEKSGKKKSPVAVIILGIVLFLAGYTLGSYVPLSSLLDGSLAGAMMRPGSNSHRR